MGEDDSKVVGSNPDELEVGSRDGSCQGQGYG